MLIGPYQISNTNSNGKLLNSVRVRRDGVILCEVRSPNSRTLDYLRKRPLSEERKEFVRQLTLCGVSAEDVAMLLQIPSKTK